MNKIFTPREVDALLPKMEGVFQHIDACRKRTHELAETRPADASAVPPTPFEIAEAARVRSQMEFLMQAVEEDIQFVGQLGGSVKDIEAGLVDFPGRVNGEDVWLCWKRGEKKIHYWHSIDAGYAQRQALKRSDDRTCTTH